MEDGVVQEWREGGDIKYILIGLGAVYKWWRFPALH